MNETIRIWLEYMYQAEIEEVRATISNERIWKRGYDGEELNPHADNIEVLEEYLEMLEEMLEELK